MARARNIKPSFFINEQLSECDPLARLLFAGLWCIADREGRLQDRPKRIKIELLPYDNCNVDKLLTQLDANGLIIRYSCDNNNFIQIIRFTKHQDPHYKEKPSEIPAPSGHADSGATGGGVSDSLRQEVFDRDGRKCLECGNTDDLSLDHKIPRSKGGGHDKENLQTLCRKCNSAKNNRLAKKELDNNSINDRPMIGQSSNNNPPNKTPLIPDSLLLIPDSPLPITESMRPDFIPAELWNGFMIVRKKAKAQNTPLAISLIVKELEKMKDNGIDYIASIENSIKSNWKDVYPPKKVNGGSNGVHEARAKVANAIWGNDRNDERIIDVTPASN